jgi:hypothetical protein
LRFHGLTNTISIASPRMQQSGRAGEPLDVRGEGLESNDIFIGCQRQYPNLLGYFNVDSKGPQEVFTTTRHLLAITRHAHPAHPVIEEFVEGFFMSPHDLFNL